MYAAPPLPPGRDLNDIERRESARSRQNFFGPPSQQSMSKAAQIQSRAARSRVNIDALFEEIEKEEESIAMSIAASSVSVVDDHSDLFIEDEVDREEQSIAASSAPVVDDHSDLFIEDEMVTSAPSKKETGKSKASKSIVKKKSKNKF